MFDIDDFKIDDVSTWTWLDFIVVYEFSNSSVRHNYFEGIKFSDLKIENNIPVFEFENDDSSMSYIIESSYFCL